jgi:outer membrane protein
MKRFFYILLSVLILLPAGMKAQTDTTTVKVWTLKDCLNYALEHNIQVQKSKVSLLSGKEDYEQAKAKLFPSLSGSVTQGVTNYPSSNVKNNNTYTGNYGLNANLTLFDGGQRLNAIKQQAIQNDVNQLGITQSENDIRISLVQTYMQVLYAIEAVRINKNTVEVDSAQVARSRQLLKAGSISRVDVAQLESQLSTDKYQLVSAQTNLDNYKLQLKQLLELDINQDIAVAVPEIPESEVLTLLPSKQSIYATALATMPEIQSSKLAVDIAQLDKKNAKAGFLPTLSLSGSLGTGHASGTGSSFSSQVWDRYNEALGLTLSIPIFSQRQHKTAYNKAQYAITTSELNRLNAEKTLLKTVEGYYLDATSAQNQFTAATEKLRYVNESYTLTEEQFFLGMKNTVELLTQKNSLLSAQQQVLQAKYMALMDIQLLNIYQNKSIDVNY